MKKAFALLLATILVLSFMAFVEAKENSLDHSESSDSSNDATNNKISDELKDDKSDVDKDKNSEDVNEVDTKHGKSEDKDKGDKEKGKEKIKEGKDDDTKGDEEEKEIEAEKRIILTDGDNTIIVEIETEIEKKGDKLIQKIKVEDVEIMSEVEVEESGGKLKAKLSNGNNQELKIMPNVASKIALETLATQNVNIELKEINEGEDKKAIYFATGEKQVKIMGLFKVRQRITAKIDPESGEVIQIIRPWWHFLVFSELPVEEPASEVVEEEVEQNETAVEPELNESIEEEENSELVDDNITAV